MRVPTGGTGSSGAGAAGAVAGAVAPSGAGGMTAGIVAGSGGSGSTGGADTGGVGSTGGTAAGTGGAGSTGGSGGVGSTGGAGGIVAGTGGAEAGTGGNGKVFDAGDPSLNNVQAGGVCERLAEIQCAGEEFCCDAPGRDRATCKQAQLAVCRDEGLVDTISANPITGFDAAHASMALQTMHSMASICDPTVATVAASTQGLAGMFKGTRVPDTDCRPAGLIPTTADGAAAVVSCANIESVACLPASDDPLGQWSCAPKGAAGAPCLTDLNCQMGMYCNNPAFAGGAFGRGTCAARKPVGMACAAGNECQSFACVQNECGASVQEAYCIAWQQ